MEINIKKDRTERHEKNDIKKKKIKRKKKEQECLPVWYPF